VPGACLCAQADAREQALLAALPLGPQTPAGGVSLPESFKGELDVVLVKARNLPVWGFPGQSNPYCRLILGEQAVQVGGSAHLPEFYRQMVHVKHALCLCGMHWG